MYNILDLIISNLSAADLLYVGKGYFQEAEEVLRTSKPLAQASRCVPFHGKWCKFASLNSAGSDHTVHMIMQSYQNLN